VVQRCGPWAAPSGLAAGDDEAWRPPQAAAQNCELLEQPVWVEVANGMEVQTQERKGQAGGNAHTGTLSTNHLQ